MACLADSYVAAEKKQVGTTQNGYNDLAIMNRVMLYAVQYFKMPTCFKF